jgi:hypothetical protein
MQTADWKMRIPAEFSDEARVWVYQSSRPFNEREEKEIEEQLLQFYSQWHAHGDAVKGWAGLLFRQFIVLAADESQVAVSGCSTDSSVRVIKSIERQYQVNLFDRLTITFLLDGKTQMLPLGQVQYAIDKGYLTADTLLFNNMAATKGELLSDWLVPLRESWLAGRVKL